MLKSSHSENLDLRSRKCGSKVNNNKHENGDADDTLSWSNESQTTRKPNTELCQTIDNTQVTEMSTTSTKKSKSHRSSLCESSTEDLGASNVNVNGNGMWRNELTQGDDALPPTESEQQLHQELSVRSSNNRLSDAIDVVLRMVIVMIFFKLETMTAFKREIHAEELWLYQNPRRPDYVKGGDLLFLVIAVPFLVTVIFYVFTKDRRDFWASTWSWTMAVCMNGIPTSLLKITVGRPRPDYFYRCFPDGIMVLNDTTNALSSTYLDFNCTGIPSEINEGRKSFPSGHSSFAFASFGFVAYYVGAKLHAFDARGRGHTWRLCIALMPLLVALLVAVSRTCDYHHHWQDVAVGAIIGIITGYFSYRQYYPSIFGTDAGTPLVRWPRHKCYEKLAKDEDSGDMLRRPLLGKQQSKWY